MKWFNFFGKSEKETRSLEYINPNNYALNLPFGTGPKSSALTLSAVYAAVNLISDSIAVLPITVKAKNEDSTTDIVDNHPLSQIFHSALLSKYALIKSIVRDVMTKGNGFAYIERDKSDNIIGLRYLQPEQVVITYRPEIQQLYYQSSYIKGKILPSNMLHFSRYTTDGITGISILSNARRSLNIASQTENTAQSFFSGGCNLNGIITIKGVSTQQQRLDALKSWQSTFNGSESGGVAVLQSNMEYQPISVSSADAQMLESRQFSVSDIARFFNISPVLIGDLTHSGYNSIEQTNLQFLEFTLNPYIVMMEEELNRKLVNLSDNIVINLDETAILRTNKKDIASYYQTLLNAGVMSINEVRKEMGYGAVDGGDKHNLAYSDTSKTDISNTDNSDSTEDENIE